jgi:hypothetical protein
MNTIMDARFESEEALLHATVSNPEFRVGLGFPEWASWQARELEWFFGIPDLIVAFAKTDLRGRPILRTCAFEFKRANWKRALVQAFRYASFAHYSYVLLDSAHSRPAICSIDTFRSANIGLLTVDTLGNITWHHRPKFQSPYSPALSRSMAMLVQARLLPLGRPTINVA